jgi:hypothetical protein
VRHIQAASALCDTHHTIAATRIGGHAYRYLAEKARSGRVVSVFRHGLNVVFDEASVATHIAIQTSAVPLHPWGIEVPAISPAIRSGQQVSSAEDCLAIAACTLGMRDAHIDDLRIAPYSAEEAERTLFRLRLVEEFLERESAHHPIDPFQAQIDAILERWQTTGDPVPLVDLVGLGIGSTPAGDDTLVGILAGLAALLLVSPRVAAHVEKLRGRLGIAALEQRTSRASTQMICAAVERRFSETLRGCALALGATHTQALEIQRHVSRQSAVGATSGVATLRGFLCAGMTVGTTREGASLRPMKAARALSEASVSLRT